MPAKKYTAKQLRTAQEVLDQEEATAAERSSRRKRKREEWYQRHGVKVVGAAVLLLFAVFIVWRAFGDFSDAPLVLPLWVYAWFWLSVMVYSTWDLIRSRESEGFNSRSFVAWIKIVPLLVFVAVLWLVVFGLFYQAYFR